MVEMELKYRVLNALSQTDGYVSGGEMAARFNVSRTLVWKAVNQLRRDGHAISTVNKLGYRLEIQSDRLFGKKLCNAKAKADVQD